MCLVNLQRILMKFNINQYGKEQGNHALGGNFLDWRVPLMGKLVSKKKVVYAGMK